MGSRHQKRVPLILAALGVFAAATFILLEIGVRALPYWISDPLKSRITEAGLMPLSNTRVYGGLRGGTVRLLPPAEPSDILVLGDSIPFGTYVREEDAYPARLGVRLGRKVVNLGVGSQSPPAYNRMFEVGLRYHPKIVIYCVFANDFVYEKDEPIRALSAANERAKVDGDRELFVESLGIGDRLVATLKSLTNLSLFYQFSKVWRQPATHVQVIAWSQGSLSYFFASREYWDVALDWHRPLVGRGIEKNTEYAQAALALAKAQGIRFHVVLIPSKEMTYGTVAGDKGSLFYSETHHETYQRFGDNLTKRQIPWIDLTQPLRERAREDQPLFHSIDGHFNEQGHEVMAELLETQLDLKKSF